VEAEVLAPETTDIIAAVFDDPTITFTNPERGKAFMVAVRAETSKLDADVTTAKGRDEIRAMASKVTRSKTLIDKSRLAMTKDLRDQVAKINEAGGQLVRELDALADEVRKPLTEWEEVEKLREERAADKVKWLRQAAVVTIADTSETVQARGGEVYGIEITKDEFGKHYAEAKELRDVAIETLKAAMERLKQEEADRAELARLRKADEERLAREAAEREEREAAERKREYARRGIDHIHEVGRGMIGGKPYPYIILLRELEEKIPPEITSDFGDLEAEARRVLAETTESVKAAMAQESERAEEAARAEAAENARREAEAEAQRKIDEANSRAAEAERAAQAEREAREAEDRARADAQRREQEEQARREKNRAHRAQVIGEIKIAIMAAGGIADEQAVKIVKAMAAGEIGRVRVEF